MGDPGFLFLFLIAAFTLFAVAGWFNARRETAALRERLKKSYGRLPERKYAPEETARIPRYFEEHIPEDIRSLLAGSASCWIIGLITVYHYRMRGRREVLMKR